MKINVSNINEVKLSLNNGKLCLIKSNSLLKNLKLPSDFKNKSLLLDVTSRLELLSKQTNYIISDLNNFLSDFNKAETSAMRNVF